MGFKKRKSGKEEFTIPYDLSDSNSEKLITINIGDINLPSGQIIASDPFLTHDAEPFRRKVKPGKYPVELSILKIEDNHYRIAFSRINFKEEKSTKWILAIPENIDLKDIKSLKREEYFGFPVEAGLGCFIDKKTNELLVRKMDSFYSETPDLNYYDDLLANEFQKYSSSNKYSRDLGDWNNHVVEESTSQNVMMFTSGWGDGFYPVYWGLNNSGEFVEIIIDFMIDLSE